MSCIASRGMSSVGSAVSKSDNMTPTWGEILNLARK